MVIKSLIAGSLLVSATAAPVAVPVMSGIPVRVSMGPVEMQLSKTAPPDFGLRTHCYRKGCNALEIQFGQDGEGAVRIGF